VARGKPTNDKVVLELRPQKTLGRKKLWGRSSRPLCRCLLQVLSAFCCFSSLLSFWLPWIYSPFPLFMEFRNGNLLQLVECIESTQNEVKRKMIEAWACNAAPKSPERLARDFFPPLWELTLNVFS
jgi:hypothetical protein